MIRDFARLGSASAHLVKLGPARLGSARLGSAQLISARLISERMKPGTLRNVRKIVDRADKKKTIIIFLLIALSLNITFNL
jgi:hypothetical protein